MILLVWFSYSFSFEWFCSDPSDALERALPTVRATSDFMMRLSDTGEEHPFYNSCAGRSRMTPRMPDGRTYDVTVHEQDSQGNKSKDFFKRLKAKVDKTLEQHTRNAENQRECLIQKNSVNDCIGVHPFMQEILKRKDGTPANFSDVVSYARFHLSLSQSSAMLSNIGNGGAKRYLNAELTSYGTYKEVNWNPLTQPEFDRSQRRLDQYQQQHRDETDPKDIMRGYDRNGVAVRFTGYTQTGVRIHQEKMREKRLAHLVSYQMIMSSNPLLQYIQSANPNQKEVYGAADSVLASLAKERAWLAEKTATIGDARGSVDLLHLLNYRSEVEAVLKENPEYCGMAQDLFTLKEAKGLELVAGTLFIGIAASVIFPPAYAAVAGVAIGAGYGVYDHMLLQEQKMRLVGRTMGESNYVKVQEIVTPEDQLQINPTGEVVKLDGSQPDTVTRTIHQPGVLDEVSEQQYMRDLGIALTPLAVVGGTFLKKDVMRNVFRRVTAPPQ